MSTITIDVQFQDYVRGVRSSGPGATLLCERLKAKAPEDIKPDEKAALGLVDSCAEVVRTVLHQRDKVAPGKLRPLLTVFANDWSAFYEALSAKARISPHLSDVGPRAATLAGSLFPDGVAFVQLGAETAWSEGFRRLATVHSEKLEKELRDLIGPEFLAGAEKSTSLLGDALGASDSSRTVPSSTALQQALADFGRAVGAYGRVLAAHCDESDPESVKRFLDAVAPMDAHRAAMRASAGTDTTATESSSAAANGTATPTQTSAGQVASPAPAPAPAPAAAAPAPTTDAPTPSSVGTLSSPAPVAPNGVTNGAAHAA